MGERFVVVQVDGGGVLADEEQPEAAVADPAPVNSGGSAAGGDQEAEENSAAQPQERGRFLPILEYNREPNKYGMAAETDPFYFPNLKSIEDFPL